MTLTPQTPQKSPSPRFEAIEAGRFVAALAVVWIHTVTASRLDGFSVLGRFAVPFFALGAAFFGMESGRRAPQKRFGEFARARFRRVYWPFVVWCAIYLFVWKARQLILRGPLPTHAIWTWPWIGTAFHLWFLPFIFVTSLAIFPIARLAAHEKWRGFLIAAGAFGGLAVALTPLKVLFPRGTDLSLFQNPWAALPAVLWGIALGIWWRGGQNPELRGRFVTIGAGVLCVGATLTMLATGRVSLLENLAGLGAFIFCLGAFEDEKIAFWARGGALSFGIYLSHLAFVIGIRAVLGRVFKVELHSESAALTLLIFVLAAACSVAFAALIGRSRARQVLLPS